MKYISLFFLLGNVILNFPVFSFAAPSKDNIIRLTDFGARGDGSSDNSSSFIKALDYASKKNSIIFVPKGDYLIDKQILINSNLHLKGEKGSNLIIGGNVKNNLFFNSKSGINIMIDNIQFTTDNVNNISNIVTFYKAVVKVINCVFNVAKPFILRNCEDILIEKCKFNNPNIPIGTILYFFASTDIRLENNTFTTTGGVAFVDGCSKIRVYNNAFSGMRNAYPLHFDFKPSQKKYHSKVIIEGNILAGSLIQAHKGGAYDQISCYGINSLLVKNNTVKGGGDMGITISHCKNVILENNICQQNYSSGISIDNTQTCIIANNKLINNGIKPNNNLLGMPESRAGLFIVNNNNSKTDSLILHKNTISNDRSDVKVYSVSIISKENLSNIFTVGTDEILSNHKIRNNISTNKYNQIRQRLVRYTAF